MQLSEMIYRIKKTKKKYGTLSIVPTIIKSVYKKSISNDCIIYYCYPANHFCTEVVDLNKYELCFVTQTSQISADDISIIFKHGSAIEIKKRFDKRFANGATMVLLKKNTMTYGFIWFNTQRKTDVDFIPVSNDEVKLFDNEIFEEYRGYGYNTILLKLLLNKLSKDKIKKVYVETATWNKSEQRSLEKNSFVPLAIARRFCILGRNITIWKRV